MDRDRFDALTRLVGTTRSRRGVMGAIIGALLLSSRPDAFADRRSSRGKAANRQHRMKTRAQAVPASCFGTGTCTPGASANLAKCDISGATLTGITCTGCNLKNASLRGANATNANFKGANFDKACLVDANLTGANLKQANTSGAIFCRTIMPDGSVNNAGCNNATSCCPTCIPFGKAGCDVGGACCDGREFCQAGTCGCPAGQALCQGVCTDVQTDRTNCGGCGITCSASRLCCAGTCVPGNCCTDAICGVNATCVGQRCQCTAPFADCDDDRTTGCETNLQTDSQNCGTCGTACATGLRCQSGACICDATSCLTGFCRSEKNGGICCCQNPQHVCLNSGGQFVCSPGL